MVAKSDMLVDVETEGHSFHKISRLLTPVFWLFNSVKYDKYVYRFDQKSPFGDSCGL